MSASKFASVALLLHLCLSGHAFLIVHVSLTVRRSLFPRLRPCLDLFAYFIYESKAGSESRWVPVPVPLHVSVSASVAVRDYCAGVQWRIDE